MESYKSNPFEIIGIVPSPVINISELKRAFIAKQREVHPDTGDDSDLSQELNSAYEILKTEEGSVKCYLMLHVSANELNKNNLPSDFLMEMMEISDFIEDFFSQNSIESQNEAKSLLFNFKSLLDKDKITLNLELSDLTANGGDATRFTQLIDKWILWYQKFRYYTRLRKNLDGIEEF